ncbi:OLC1v1030239C1 [Oldenlandia corymbosa var. corymbosa]|uniref:OLC1v1030239C1 n=1 Tax=Oldenlandia corymbosa var. corymbosa TaxID=529605 RepID=A0AAV1CGD7_OLDCO|nr:OLC1v1030239C1 [Oldenlandia corymbosa var. corymbosa]
MDEFYNDESFVDSDSCEIMSIQGEGNTKSDSQENPLDHLDLPHQRASIKKTSKDLLAPGIDRHQNCLIGVLLGDRNFSRNKMQAYVRELGRKSYGHQKGRQSLCLQAQSILDDCDYACDERKELFPTSMRTHGNKSQKKNIKLSKRYMTQCAHYFQGIRDDTILEGFNFTRKKQATTFRTNLRLAIQTAETKMMETEHSLQQQPQPPQSALSDPGPSQPAELPGSSTLLAAMTQLVTRVDRSPSPISWDWFFNKDSGKLEEVFSPLKIQQLKREETKKVTAIQVPNLDGVLGRRTTPSSPTERKTPINLQLLSKRDRASFAEGGTDTPTTLTPPNKRRNLLEAGQRVNYEKSSLITSPNTKRQNQNQGQQIQEIELRQVSVASESSRLIEQRQSKFFIRIDGAFKQDSWKGGAAWEIVSESRIHISSRRETLFAQSALHTEARACLRGLQSPRDLGPSDVDLQTDNVAVSAIIRGKAFPEHLTDLGVDIHSLAQSIPNTNMYKVDRSIVENVHKIS